MDISDLFNLPLPYIFAILTGYVLASLFAEDTSFWRNRESFEKLLIGGALGLGLLLGVTFPIVYLSSAWIPMNFEQALQHSGSLLVACFLFLPLSAHIGRKASKERIFTLFAYVTLYLPYAFLLEVILTWILVLKIATYPEYLLVIIKPYTLIASTSMPFQQFRRQVYAWQVNILPIFFQVLPLDFGKRLLRYCR